MSPSANIFFSPYHYLEKHKDKAERPYLQQNFGTLIHTQSVEQYLRKFTRRNGEMKRKALSLAVEKTRNQTSREKTTSQDSDIYF